MTPGPIANVSGPLRIGSSAGGGYFHDGRLDEILIHRRALSPIEIQRTFAAAGRTSGSHTVQGNFYRHRCLRRHCDGNAGDGILLQAVIRQSDPGTNLLSANGLDGRRMQVPPPGTPPGIFIDSRCEW